MHNESHNNILFSVEWYNVLCILVYTITAFEKVPTLQSVAFTFSKMQIILLVNLIYNYSFKEFFLSSFELGFYIFSKLLFTLFTDASIIRMDLSVAPQNLSFKSIPIYSRKYKKTITCPYNS